MIFLYTLRKLLILCLIGFSLNAQRSVSFGLSGTYNIPLETIGTGIRASIPLSPAWAVSPQIRYNPAFNDIHELSAGSNLHYYFIRNFRRQVPSYRAQSRGPLYLIAGVHYNRWINYSESLNKKAKKNNILPEIGMGAALGGNILKVFLEGKYNPLWLEPSAEAGLLVYPFNKSSKLKCFY